MSVRTVRLKFKGTRHMGQPSTNGASRCWMTSGREERAGTKSECKV